MEPDRAAATALYAWEGVLMGCFAWDVSPTWRRAVRAAWARLRAFWRSLAARPALSPRLERELREIINGV